MLGAGVMLGPYRIVAALGAGGMGEVYRAHDSRLGRDVAIKVLPERSLLSPDARARFEREARTISQLSHPHICTLYDVGRAPGAAGSGETEFLVMELLEGETLAHRIARGPLPVADVLKLGAEIASALDRAHAAGVVHRDLKPGNVMLTKSGAKLMDFGLARVGATPASASGAALSASPTMTQPITSEGAIVGTFEYMAPEQLEGKEADARADIWALGCVLYEMATGQRAFAGGSRASLIAAIMDREPRPIAELQPLSPLALQNVVARCLAKDPADRWHSASDLAFSLQAIRDDGASSASGVRVAAAGPAVPGRGRHSRARVALLVAIPVLALVTAAAWFITQSGPPRVRRDIAFRNLTLPTPNISYPGLSPDGKWVVFAAGDNSGGWDLYFSSVSGGASRRITQDSSLAITGVAVSPDGERIAYGVQDRATTRWGLRMVPVLGGESRWVGRDGQFPRWSPDGGRIAFVAGDDPNPMEYWTSSPTGAEPRLEFRDSVYTIVRRVAVAWSPDGRRLAMIRNDAEGRQSIVVKDLMRGTLRTVTRERENIDDLWWAVPNTLFFSTNRGGNYNVWAIRGNGGPAVQVTRGGGPDLGVQASADGQTLLFYQEHPSDRLWSSPLERAEPVRITEDEVTIKHPVLSPDGRHIAVTIYGGDQLAAAPHVFVMSAEGSGRRAVTSGDQRCYLPEWSPDGRRLAYAGRATDTPLDSSVIYVADPWAGTPPLRLGYGRPILWTAQDGLLTYTNEGTFVTTLDGPASRRSPDSTIIRAQISPGVVIYADQHVQRLGVWLGRSESPDRLVPIRRVLLTSGVPEAVDRARGLIYQYASDGRLVRIDPVSGRVTPVPGTFSGLTTRSALSVSPDGRTLLYTESVSAARVMVGERIR